MWFLESEVVPVSRPQHSDLHGEDNKGNRSLVKGKAYREKKQGLGRS